MSSQTIVSAESEPRPTPQAEPKRSSWWRIPIFLLVIGAATGGIWYVVESRGSKASPQGPTPEAVQSQQGVPVDVVRPKRGGMERISNMSGSVHAYESADLVANVSGYLKTQEVVIDGKNIPVDIGVHVKKGDLLAQIDVPEVLADAEQAEADVKQAEAQVVQAAAKVETAQADEKAAEAAVTQAHAEVGRYTAQRNETWKAFQRYKGLRGMSAVDQDVVDQRQDAYESASSAESAAKAAVLTSEAQVVAAKAKVAQAEADLKAAQSAVAVAQAKLKRARAIVEYTQIKSPYTGVITHREYFPGDFIRSASEGNTRPMLTVARTDVMRIATKISDKDVPYADVGDPAVVTLDALPGVKLQGTISRFTEAEDPTERTMETEIDLPNDEPSPAHGKLREGMYGLATIILQPPSENLTVPSSCLTGQTDGSNGHLLVVRGRRASMIPVQIGVDDGVRVEILSGLSADDVVLVPNGAVADGTLVAPTDMPAAKADTPSH